MIPNLPIYISLTFALTTFATLFLFVWAIKNSTSENMRKKSMPILIGLVIWLAIQAVLTLKNVYNTDVNSFPPKIMLFGIMPPIFTIILLFGTKKWKAVYR